MSIAVLDIGKTNAKVVLVSDAGDELDERRMPNAVRDGPPYRHFDEAVLWGFILNSLQDFARHTRQIIPVTHGACAALVTEDGHLALPVLDYEDPGPDTARDSYTPPPFTETGSPPMPGGLNVGAQMHWLERTFLDQFRRASHLLPWPQYWSFRLTGQRASEVTSLACHTDLWSPHAATPSTLARTRGWDHLFAPMRRAGDILGPILPAVAAETGLPPETLVRTGIHDSNASLLPYLAQAPCAVVSTGTWVITMALGGEIRPLNPSLDVLLNVAADGRLVPTAPFMGGRDRDAAVRSGTPEDEADRQIAARTAQRLLDVGARGPVFVEGPFAESEAFLSDLRRRSGRAVHARGSGAGTTRGAALLARDG